MREMYRAKNPCVLFRLMWLGWYVLLGNNIIGSSDESPEEWNYQFMQNSEHGAEEEV